MEFDTRVGCYAWIERDGQVLLPHWYERGADGRPLAGWTLPGGGMEHGESPEATCLREVREETGFTVELESLLGVRNHWIPTERRKHLAGRPMQALQVVYLARITGGTLTREVDGTTDDVRWLDLKDLPGLHTVSLVDAAAGWAAARRGVLS
jgi:8-oxo-dGTP diphosphatase